MSSRTVFAAIAGRANVGKSSLINALVGERIAIVSGKPQTTRTKITGILTEGDIQYVFIDTPGIQKVRNKLATHMNNAVRDSIPGTDAALLVADITAEPGEFEEKLINAFRSEGIPVILLLNKTDLITDDEKKTAATEKYASLYDFAAVLPISVLKREGIGDVLVETARFAKEGPHYYPDDKFTDQPEEILAAEMIRGRLFNAMYDEIPHGIAVTVEKMSESVSGKGEDILNIDAVIYCERESHKGMVIGKGGTMLKKIGSAARADLEEFFEIRVNLKLWVKVKEDWRNKESLIRSFGLSEKD